MWPMNDVSNLEPNYVHGSKVRVWHPTEDSLPRCEIENDRCLLEARIYRCFPLSAQDGYISFQDAGGHEACIVKSISELDDETRAAVEIELDRRYFTPVIARIASLKQEASLWKFDVDTQRGAHSFYLRGVRDNIHEVAPRRWQLRSIDGQRYEIRDLSLLDKRSVNLFESLF